MTRPAATRRRCIATMATAVLFATTLLPSVALAQEAPEETPDPPSSGSSATQGPAVAEPITQQLDGTWRFPLSRLGFGPTTRLTGQVAALEVFVGVPPGLSLDTFVAGVFVSPDVTDGFVEVRDGDDRVLDTIEVGESVDERDVPGRLVAVDISDAAVRDGGATIKFLSRLRSVDDICSTAFVGAHVDFNDAAIHYAGDLEAPSSVGEFFAPVLGSVNLVVPASPSVAEIDAAVTVGAAIVSRYRGLDLDFVVTTGAPASGPSGRATPFDRTVVIGEGGAGLSVSGGATPVLTVGGGDEQIGQQADLIASSLAPLSIGEAVTVAGIESVDDLDRRRVSFDELGLRNLQVTGVGQLGLPITVTQFDLGGPVDSLHAELFGSHTPTTDGIQATLEIFVNDVLVHTDDLDDSGTFAADFDIEGSLLRRDTELDVRVAHTPAGGECRLGVHPFIIQVDPGSYFDVSPGQGLPPGFTRFPQVLRPGFEMLVAGDALSVESAIELLALLQALAGEPLRPEVVGELSDSSAAVVVGGPETVADLDLPLEPDGFRVVGPEGEEVLRLDVDRDFAVLEGFRDGGRDVLALTYRSDPGLMKDLLDGLAAERTGWFVLSGDTYLRPAGDTPVELRLRGAELTAEPVSPPGESFWESYRAIVIGVLAVLAIAFLVWAYPRVVRPAPSAT